MGNPKGVKQPRGLVGQPSSLRVTGACGVRWRPSAKSPVKACNVFAVDYTPCVRVFGVFLMRLQQSRLQSQQTLLLLYYIKLLQELQTLLQTCITANGLFGVSFDVFLQEVHCCRPRALTTSPVRDDRISVSWPKFSRCSRTLASNRASATLSTL